MRKAQSSARHGEAHRSIPTIAFAAAVTTVLFAARYGEGEWRVVYAVDAGGRR